MKKTSRSLLLAVAASAMLLPVSALQNEEVYGRGLVQIRAGVLTDSSAITSTDVPTSAAATSQAATSAVQTSSATAATATSAAAPTEASSSQAAQSTVTKGATSAAAPATTAAVTSSAIATTDSSGQVVTSFIEFTPTPSSPAPSHTETSSNSSSSDGGGLSTGSIIGLSVAGGIAAIAIILFFVWKFTRKRFSDFDDNEAIKWPELNAHNTDVHALPTNSTGRAGFGPENDSDVNLTRAPSPGAYANSITASVPDAYAGDPYAVPPLPHLNPNQPYHDEPGAYGQVGGFYDPYRGPVPNAFGDTVSDGLGAESIPMTQMARMRSPGPQAVYDMQGRGSPVPQAAMGYSDERSRTPTSVALSAGRASPSPNPGYGYGPR